MGVVHRQREAVALLKLAVALLLVVVRLLRVLRLLVEQ